jgi:hypothetical protein
MKAKKILSATSKNLSFTGDKKISTQARINQLLALLEIDKQLHQFKQIMIKADRLQKNKHNLIP